MKQYALIACILSASSYAQDYFPLHVGNQWIYRTAAFGRVSLTVVDIPRTQTIGDQLYSVVQGLAQEPALLRSADGGTLLRYNPETRTEEVWAAFGTKEGDTYRTAIDPCNQTARVESRSAKATVPAAEFGNALAIRYPAANCADAGLDSDVFAPYIGLVERTSVTIAGPRKMQLIYARVGGVTVLSEPEASFAVTASQAAGNLTARLTLRNSSAEPLVLDFNSGQRFNIVIRDSAGVEVYNWAAARTFIQLVGREEIASGERNWAETIPLAFPAGRYTMEAWLTTAGARREFASTVSFVIR